MRYPEDMTKLTKKRTATREPARDTIRARAAGEITAVLDTNVFVDLYSWHDAAEATPGPRRDYRFRRVGEALRLAIHLHKRSAVTWSLKHEPIETLVKHSPPSAGVDGPGASMTAYTRFVIYFVKDRLCPRWCPIMPHRERRSVRGNDADTRLLREAKKLNVPLITSEGNLHTPGKRLHPKSLRARAQAEGVAVFTPGEFCLGKVSDRDIALFLERFRKLGPKVYAGHEHYNRAQFLLTKMHDYYQHALEMTKT
jgi:hypothetical protein